MIALKWEQIRHTDNLCAVGWTNFHGLLTLADVGIVRRVVGEVRFALTCIRPRQYVEGVSLINVYPKTEIRRLARDFWYFARNEQRRSFDELRLPMYIDMPWANVADFLSLFGNERVLFSDEGIRAVDKRYAAGQPSQNSWRIMKGI